LEFFKDLDLNSVINSENKNIRLDSVTRKNSDFISIKNTKNYSDIKGNTGNINIKGKNFENETILRGSIETKGNNEDTYMENQFNEDTIDKKRKYSQSLLFSNTKTKKKFDVIVNPKEEKTSLTNTDISSFHNLQEAKNFLKSSIINQGKKNISSNSQNMDNNQNMKSDIFSSNVIGNLILNIQNQSKNEKLNNLGEINSPISKKDNTLIKDDKLNDNTNKNTFLSQECNKNQIREKAHSKVSTKNLFPAKSDNNNIFDLKDIESIYNDDPLNITNEEQEELKTDILKLKNLIDSKTCYRFSHFNDDNTYYNKIVTNFDNVNSISNKSVISNSKCNIKNNENFYFNVKNSIYDWENYFNDKFIESKLRSFFYKNKNRFIKKICKGPPETFRWISWIITSKIPADRNEDFYNKFLKKELRSDVLIQIKKDIGRTFPKSIKKKYFHNIKLDLNLFRILKALAIKDPEVGYCQGMNFIAGFLLIVSNFNELEAFYMMLSLLNYTGENDFGIRGFYTMDFPLLKLYLFIFQYFFTKKLPALKAYFDKLDIPDELWISKWIQTLFTIVLPYDAVKRVWDFVLTNGLDFIISFSIAYLKFLEPDLLKLNDTIDIINFFKKLSPQKDEEEYEDSEYFDPEQENSLYFLNIEKSNPNNVNSHNRDTLRKSSIDENTNYSKFNIEEIIRTASKLNLKKSQFETLKKKI